MKLGPVAAELFHADRRTDLHDEANSSFSEFCERALKNPNQPMVGKKIISVLIHKNCSSTMCGHSVEIFSAQG
jgi:hypothetical protein